MARSARAHRRGRRKAQRVRRKFNKRRGHRARRPRKNTGKRSTRNKTGRHGLVEAIGKYLPGQFFSQWKVVRGTQWTAQRLFWISILMMLCAEQTLSERFGHARRTLRELFPKWSLGKSFTGFCKAQLKWTERLTPALIRRLQGQMQCLWGRWQYREGWCAFAVDGSRVECPRTKQNKKRLGCAGRERTSPQLFVTTLWHMGLGIPWDFRIGNGKASERRHLQEMLAHLPGHSLIVGDAGFQGYDYFRAILRKNHNFLSRVGANVHLLKNLGYYEQEGPDIVYLWPKGEHHQRPLVLRLIKLKKGKQQVYLVTNVLDQKVLSDQSANLFYEMRWGVEVFYRTVKQTLQRRKMLSRTPAAAQCELTWVMFGMWLLALLSVGKIVARGAEPLSWSAALARQRIRQSIRMALRKEYRDRSLLKDLGNAVKDKYARKGSKKAHDWPHKKNDPPPGVPKIRSATPAERKAAQRFTTKETQTWWTA
jgi:Transposase DDE domain